MRETRESEGYSCSISTFPPSSSTLTKDLLTGAVEEEDVGYRDEEDLVLDAAYARGVWVQVENTQVPDVLQQGTIFQEGAGKTSFNIV